MASEITDEEIEALAKGIGINNKIDGLGLQLGYEYSAIDIYKASNNSGAIVSHQGTRQMLKDWREKTPQERQRPVLKKALEDAGLVSLDEKHLEARKRRVNTSPGPAQKRQKVTESGPNSKAKSPGKPPNVTKKKATTKKATTKKATMTKATTKKATTKKATTKKATMTKATTKKATTKKATPKKATTKKATTAMATTKKATTAMATTKKATTAMATTKKTTTAMAIAKKATTKKATPKKATTKKATTKKATTKKATTKKATPNKITKETDTSQRPSRSRLRRGRKPVTVHQSGGALTSNAPRRSKVKGNTMTRSMTTVTTLKKDHLASTSQSLGRKGKAATSSGDDTDKNEGLDDQLTSLKQDSGSNRDDISYGDLSAPPEILARGPRALRAYAEAAQDGKKKVFRTRLMLVGQERVGKTSLKKTLTGQGFDENEAKTDCIETTNSCEISIEVAKAGGKIWSIHKKGHENEDTKPDEYSKAVADEMIKKLIVTPPQNQLQESLEPLSNTTHGRGLNPEKSEEVVLDNMEAPKAKEEYDNMPKQIANLVEKMLKEQVHLKEMGLMHSTDSGRGEGLSLIIWDFAGQDIYYTTHQVFLTWRAIYVIVFDLSRSLDSVVPPESRDKYYKMAKGGAKSELTCLEFINFWLCSIFAHAMAPSSVRSKNTSKTAQKSPPIFIVGTHRESVKGDAKEKREKTDSAFEKIRESIKKKPFESHVVPKYYAIENSLEDEDEELVALRSHIEKVAMEEPYMGEEIPHRWLLFEKVLAAEKINHMSLDQTKELTKQVGMESESELLTMLTFYHDLGYVVYYGGIEDLQPLLRDTVILNPQWLIDVFKRVITILDPKERDGIMSAAWNTLEDKGILEDRLIEHMWRDLLGQKEFLVELMVNFDLICEAPVEQEVSNETEKVVKKRYYVPSRLTTHCRPLEEIEEIKSSTDFYVDFNDFLPDGLFHRLMARAVRWMGERGRKPGTLFYRQISLIVDGEHRALLEMLPPREASIKVTVFKGAVANSKDDDGDNLQPPAPSAVKEVMDLVRETLDSFRQLWAKGIQYDVRFPCPQCGERKLFEDCFKGESIWCERHRILTAEVRSKFGMSEEGVESGNQSPMLCRRSKSVTLQSGGAQTINASGSSKVKGVIMTGPVTNMIIHNHPAEASTSQRQGGKRKVAASSGGKKRVKMDGKR